MPNFRPPYDNNRTTVELYELIENGVKLWDFEYPSYYQGEAKTAFEQKVIDHYYLHQIGHETVGRFLHQFRARVREIAPYFKQLYESVDLMMNQGDPFEAYNLTETYIREHSGTGKATGKTTSQSSDTATVSVTSESGSKVITKDTENTSGTSEKNGTNDTDLTRKFSNTPQGSISNLNNYMTEATVENNGSESSENETNSTERTLNGEQTTESDSKTNTTQTGEGDSSGTSETSSEDSGMEKYTLTRRGNIGVQPLGAEMEYYRKALINVDLLFINELRDLFLLIY